MRTVLCLLFLLLAGCGQKGQLYLPSEPPAATSVDTQETPETPVEEKKKDDSGDGAR